MRSRLKSEYKKLIEDVQDTFRLGNRLHALAFKSFGLVYALTFATIFLIAVLPYAMNKILGNLIDVISGLVEGKGKVDQLNLLFGLFMAVIVLMSLAGIARSMFSEMTRIKLRVIFADMMTRKYSSLNLEHYENPKLNDTIQRARESYYWAPQNFIWDNLGLFADFSSIIVGAVILASFNASLVALILATSIPGFFLNYKNIRESWELERKESKNFRDTWWTRDYLEREKDLQEIWVFKAAKYLSDRAHKIYSSTLEKFISIDIKYSKLQVLSSLISNGGFVLIFWLLIKNVLSADITIGTFTFFLATTRGFSSSLSSVLSSLSDLLGQVNHIRDIFGVIDLKETMLNGKKKLKLNSSLPPKIEFKNVWFKYPRSERYVYKNLNLTINPGDNVALIGKNGAGKTTLVKLLCRFYDVTKGKIVINGIDIKNLDVNSWYDHLALLSQDFVRYHFDAKTNIRLGKLAEKRFEKIKEAAQKSGADEFIEKEFPKKYGQALSKRFSGGTEPSVGQWQKVALARAFFKDAPVLVLDEPTSAIDPKSEYEIFSKIFSLDEKEKKVDKSIIIISHRFSTVRNAKKRICIVR